MFVIVLLIALINIYPCTAKVTDKQYASMPLIFHQDNFDQCMLLEEDALYCSFVYQLEPKNPLKVPEVWNTIREISSDEYNYRHDHLRHSICVPITCGEKANNNNTLRETITRCYNRKYSKLELKGTILSMSCHTNKPTYPVDFFDILVGTIFISYIVMVISVSLYDGLNRFREEAKNQNIDSIHWEKLMLAFSLPRNWQRLVTVKATKEMKQLKFLQGIRFFNMVLVIITHTILSFVMGPVANTKFTETMNDKLLNIFFSSGSIAVSTNFLMASFLLSYGIFSRFENKEFKLKYLTAIFINRYVRLTPILFVITMFQATWWRHIDTGPNWDNVIGSEYLRCRENWWTNILYVNNIIDKENMCLPQTWYLALDTQYFIILLLLIKFMIKYPKFVWPILGFCLIVSMIATFVQNYVNNFTAILIATPEIVYGLKNVLPNRQWHCQTTTFVGCIAGSIVGLGYGYLLYKNRDKKLFEKNRLFHHIMHYVIAYSGPFCLITIPGIMVLLIRVPQNTFLASLFHAVNRPLFSLMVGYGIFTTIFNIGGGIIKSILGCSPFCVLARLTYGAYLVHLSIVFYRSGVARSPLYVSDFSIFVSALGDLCGSFLFSLILTLFIEFPISQLQKLLMPIPLEESTKDIKEGKKL